MNKNHLILSLLALQPVFCMEVENNEEKRLLEIPREIFENEILLSTVIELIKDSVKTDDLQNFFAQLNNLFLIDKSAKTFLCKYFPERNWLTPVKNIDQNYATFTPLIIFAARTNNLLLTKLILENTKPVQEDLNIALYYANFKKNDALMILLLKYGADTICAESLKSYRRECFHSSAEHLLNATKAGNTTAIKHLFLNGATVKSAHEHNYTLIDHPLIERVINSNIKIIKLFLAYCKSSEYKDVILKQLKVRGKAHLISLLEK